MAAITNGTLTTETAHYYNSALDTTGGYIAVTGGQCRFLDIYVSAKCYGRYGQTTPTSPRIFVHPAGSVITVPKDPSKKPGEDWEYFVKAATGTLEISATAHNLG